MGCGGSKATKDAVPAVPAEATTKPSDVKPLIMDTPAPTPVEVTPKKTGAPATAEEDADVDARGESGELSPVDKAAVRVQSLVRGHLQRDALEEGRRLEWYAHYCKVGDYEQALELAVTQQEMDEVRNLAEKAKLSADTPASSAAADAVESRAAAHARTRRALEGDAADGLEAE